MWLIDKYLFIESGRNLQYEHLCQEWSYAHSNGNINLKYFFDVICYQKFPDF